MKLLKMGPVKSKGLRILLLAIIILAACYVAASIYFMKHYLPNTTINGIDASMKSISTVKKEMANEISDYQLTITERNNNKETITGESIGLTPEFGTKLEDTASSQPAFAWLFLMASDKKYELKSLVTYNESELKKQLSELDCTDTDKMTASADATISEYKEGTGCTIVPEVYGTTLDDSAFDKTVKTAVTNLQSSVSLEDSGCYVDPVYTSDSEEIKQALKEINKYTSIKITYDMDDVDPIVVDGKTIRGWLKLTKKKKVKIDKDAIADYVSDFANTYNTAYRTRSLKTASGKTVSVSGGSYGWKLNQSGEVSALVKNVKAAKDVERDPVWQQTASSHGEHDYGNTYVAIDLSAQHLYYYKNGSVFFETDLVSGNISLGNGTPTGTYSVKYKERNATLNGADYATKVSYWMPFNGNIGMHDATWRSTFGGTIYKTNGSHGCINLPYSSAQKIFENIKTGCPVLVYK